MKQSVKKYKVFKWERYLLQIPLNFTKLYIRHLKADPGGRYSSRVYERWKICYEIDGKEKEYFIPETVYNEINEWIIGYEPID